MNLAKRFFRFSFFVFLFASTLTLTASAFAQGSLEDVFKQTLEDLFKNKQDQQAEADRVPSTKAEIDLTFAPLVKQVAPSVVNVYAARKVVQRRSPLFNDPFFERFFGGRSSNRPRERIQSSLGSGVIVSSDGTIITNHHVIKDADEVKIALSDGSEYDADIIVRDEKSDLAVLKVREEVVFQALEVGDSDSVEVGDLVLAIGNPFGVGQTVTSGIVSAVARSQIGINDFGFFIQTDAAINPGNSGGALVDMRGRLIGVNTAIFSRSGGSNGIGFAVPSNMVNVVIRTANAGEGSVLRPWLGADFQNVTTEIAESLGMRRPGGVLVASIYPDGPAQQAGLRAGDIVLGINKNVVRNNEALGYRLDTIGIGGQAELVVISDGERKTITLTLEKPPETTPRNETLLDSATVLGGAVIANLSPAVAQELSMRSIDDSVVVISVDQQSRAARNGVRRGDIILAINDVEVNTVADIVRSTSRSSRGGWRVVLLRNNRQIIFERNGNFFRRYQR